MAATVNEKIKNKNYITNQKLRKSEYSFCRLALDSFSWQQKLNRYICNKSRFWLFVDILQIFCGNIS
jgi:hypothetical protein